MFQLEKYHGRQSRYTCPNCQKPHQFSHYVNDDGEYLSEEVGRCNRESKCGYHLTPKLFFMRNDYQSMGQDGFKPKKRSQSLKTPNKPINGGDCIDIKVVDQTLTNYENNAFVQFLLKTFPNKFDAIQNTLQNYLVGTWRDNRTVFWQIDRNYKIRTGKLIVFNQQTGKRTKNVGWIHSELKRTKEISNNFQLSQCYFGEHLLQTDDSRTIAIVESEKTAIIASIQFPELIWLSVGGKSFLSLEKLSQFKNRKIILFPDADAYSIWLEKISIAYRNSFDISVSDLIEKYATDYEKVNGYDLADYLLSTN